jgi:hypothetical protein
MVSLRRFFRPVVVIFAALFAVAGATFLTRGTVVMAVQHHPARPSVKLISPKAGDTFQPGDQVTITWEVNSIGDGPPVGCEQEIYLSVNKGKSVAARLTPELPPTIYSYLWTVPNLPTKKAVLIMNYGCETGDSAFETSHPQKESVFRIAPAPPGYEEVALDSAQKSGTSSSDPQIDLRWHSTVQDVDSFEVLVSYDHGAHFGTIGRTAEQGFEWSIDKSLSGVLTFKIVAHKSDGSQIESIVDPNLTVVAGRGQ